jgi:hypothetical protein
VQHHEAQVQGRAVDHLRKEAAEVRGYKFHRLYHSERQPQAYSYRRGMAGACVEDGA